MSLVKDNHGPSLRGVSPRTTRPCLPAPAPAYRHLPAGRQGQVPVGRQGLAMTILRIIHQTQLSLYNPHIFICRKLGKNAMNYVAGESPQRGAGDDVEWVVDADEYPGKTDECRTYQKIWEVFGTDIVDSHYQRKK